MLGLEWVAGSCSGSVAPLALGRDSRPAVSESLQRLVSADRNVAVLMLDSAAINVVAGQYAGLGFSGQPRARRSSARVATELRAAPSRQSSSGSIFVIASN